MIWKLSPTLESLAVGRTIVNSNRKKKKKKNNQQGLLYVNNIINKNKNVKTNNISTISTPEITNESYYVFTLFDANVPSQIASRNHRKMF